MKRANKAKAKRAISISLVNWESSIPDLLSGCSMVHTFAPNGCDYDEEFPMLSIPSKQEKGTVSLKDGGRGQRGLPKKI